MGHSGKFKVYDAEAGSNDTNAVTVTMGALREVDANGNAAGTSGSAKHSIQTFASQDFSMSDAVDSAVVTDFGTVAARVTDPI